MRRRTDFHPDLRRIAAVLPGDLVAGRRSTAVTRLALRLAGRWQALADAEVHEVSADAVVRLHRPDNPTAPMPAMLWIHGGGYISGTATQEDRHCRRFVDELGIAVAAVEYRLAPEHPYPAGLDDCYAALSWLAQRPDVDSTRLAIGGESAGGGLTAAVALMARDRGEIAPALQVLAYPMLDDRTVAPNSSGGKGYRLWDHRGNGYGWQCYLGDADRDVAVPARCTNFSEVAPAWIGVGTLDLFHDECVAYADRLNESGVQCHLEVVPGAFHAFDMVAKNAAVSRSFFASQCQSLRAALTPGVPDTAARHSTDAPSQ